MITGILLAAGRSTRMGATKVLLPWRGVPLVRHVAGIALQSQLDQLLVVVGHRAADVRAALHELPLDFVENTDFALGQSTSLHAGLNACDPATTAVVVLLADQPLLQPQTIDTLITAYIATQPLAIVPYHAGQRGNPVLIARPLFGELAQVSGDQGARQVLQAHRSQVVHLEVPDRGVTIDIDTPDLYARLQQEQQ